MNEPDQLGRVRDPVVRARAAHRLITETQAQMLELAAIRRRAIQEMLTTGMQPVEIADLLGVTRGRVHQLLQRPAPPEPEPPAAPSDHR